MAGDVANYNQFIQASDAQRIQKYFVYAGNCVAPLPSGCWDTRGPWVYWKTGNPINNNNPGYFNETIGITILASDPSTVTLDLLGMSTGDFNGSFTPSIAVKASGTLQLTYDKTIQISANTEFELPIRTVNAMNVGAVSLVLNFPSDLVEVHDVLMNGGNDQLDWSVDGNELRIGWNSMSSLTTVAGSDLFTLKLKTTADFTDGSMIQFTLAQTPLNEMADQNFNVIPDAVLSIDAVAFSPTGINEEIDNQNLTLNVYPNPFTDYTTITYTLPVDGRASIEIHDLVGKVVNTLMKESMVSGKYTLRMNGIYMPGVYIAVLTLQNHDGVMMRTQKIIRLK
jgi:hypothetical protein